MPNRFITADLKAVLAERAEPAVTLWNRLEGRPRTETFERALRAEIRDPLWMLTRQWQVGEFRGDDAGSPIVAKVRVETARLQKYAAGDARAEPFDESMPFETRVEQMPIRLAHGAQPMSLDVRLLLGRYWLKLVAPLASAAAAEYVAAYPVDSPDPQQPAAAPIVAHPEAWAAVAAVAGRAMDGGKLYAHLKQPGGRASDGIASLAGRKAQADALGGRFVAWFERVFAQPSGPDAWVPDRLEYQFSCSATERDHEKVLIAEEYSRGQIDWYELDVDRARERLGDAGMPAEGDAARTLSMVPAPATFGGMPHSRWWTFEEGRTNFGEIRPDTTDLAKLLLIEFGLVYANDWHIVPCAVPAGTVATIRGMAVTTVFGDRIWIDHAGAGDDEQWQRWAMFLMSVEGQGHDAADLSLLTPPAAHTILDGPPIEEVVLARDEMANMVWAIEKTVPLPSGESKPGREAADETRRFFEQALERQVGHRPEPPPAASNAHVRYQVMSSVPEHWIPFIPVHVPGDNREIQLQRASMPRLIDGDPDPPVPVRPRTSLLRPGLDTTPRAAYFLHEEEVPRAGVRVWQRYRRTRSRDGRVWVWLAVGKQTGRGEGSSGLAFDRLVDVR